MDLHVFCIPLLCAMRLRSQEAWPHSTCQHGWRCGCAVAAWGACTLKPWLLGRSLIFSLYARGNAHELHLSDPHKHAEKLWNLLKNANSSRIVENSY